MRDRIHAMLMLAGFAYGLITDGAAIAASFDCRDAASAREKVICGDPVLSQLDKDLGRTYRERRTMLSPHGAKVLQNSERSWLHFVSTVCPNTNPPNSENSWTPAYCLKKRYEDRLKQIQRVGERFGPFIFSRVDIFAAEPAPDQTGDIGGFYVHHVAYPQIDNPTSTQSKSWNARSIRTLSGNGDCGKEADDDQDYTISYANERLISMGISISEYCHGAAGEFYTSGAQNFVLAPSFRALTARDVFGRSHRWVGRLETLVWQKFDKNGWTKGWTSEEQKDIKERLGYIVIRPDNWVFTKDGLSMAFNHDEVGYNIYSVIISWSELKSLLPQDSILR